MGTSLDSPEAIFYCFTGDRNVSPVPILRHPMVFTDIFRYSRGDIFIFF